ncbi:MAG: DinB family protein [Acidobacteriia bacterium]|nr:DinB family protein [Terriglobia bacterium]
MMNLGPLMERLHRTRERFEAAARRIPGPHWRTPPKEGAWSAAEIVAHVTMVETLMTGATAKITRKPPVAVPLLKRFHVPVALVAWRGRRVATPIPLDTLLLDDRDVMLSRLADQRTRTFSLLEAGREKNLRRYRLQHPFLGSLHYYDWFRLLAAHDVRHAKQLDEVRKVHKSS